MSEAEGIATMDVSEPGQNYQHSKDDEDSGIKDRDSWHSCSNSNSTRDSAEDDEGFSSSKKEHNLLSISRSCESTETNTKQQEQDLPAILKSQLRTFQSEEGLAVSPGGARFGVRPDERVGAGKKKVQREPGQLPLQLGKQQNGTDFHSLFMRMPSISTLPSTSDVKEGLNNPLPAEGFLSRETMLQLTSNINSGFFYISNAFELLKQSQMELYQAKNTLERIYRRQHGEFVSDLSTDLPSPGYNDGVSEGSHEHRTRLILNDTDNSCNRDCEPESFQVHVDPFDFVEPKIPVVSDYTISRGPKIGRGPKREGRGGQRRARRSKREFSNYNSENAKKGIRHLVCQLGNLADHAGIPNGKNIRVPAVVLHDLQRILQNEDEIKPNTYSTAKVQRHMEMSAKSRTEKQTGLMQVDTIDDNSDDHQSPLKQVSVLSNSNEENVSVLDRKGPVMTTNSHNIAPKDEQKRLLPEKKDKLPHWRQLRLDPETLKRVQERLRLMQTPEF